jgi:DNA-3-methyladenine glycosylase
MNTRISREFFLRDVLDLAWLIPGKHLVLATGGSVQRYQIREVEAYRGEEDQACHARKGRTPRTRVMYFPGGYLYVYLIYGMHWMLNIVTGPEDFPQALLIRSLSGVQGPGRLTRGLGLDGSYNTEDLVSSPRIWMEDNPEATGGITTQTRIGIDYAAEEWRNKPWRFILQDH